MGKRNKEITKVEAPNNNSSKKHKKKRSLDDNNPETATGDKGDCKYKSADVLDDTEVRIHKKKNKTSALSDQEVIIKLEKQIKKEEIKDESQVNEEDNDLTLGNASTNMKNKKKRKFKLEIEADLGKKENEETKSIESKVDQEVIIKLEKQIKKEDIKDESQVNEEDNDLTLGDASTNKKNKKKRKIKLEIEADLGKKENEETKSIESKVDQEVIIKLEKQIKKEDIKDESQVNEEDNDLTLGNASTNMKNKKKRKFKLETDSDLGNKDIEETKSIESKVECLDAENVNNTKTKKKKKKHGSLENQLEEKSINDQSIETTTQDKNKIKNKNTENDLSVDNNKKDKPVTAKFNSEEAAVTEEEINQFCDEIDEEDNKQYEEWVQLLENMLGPKKHVKNET